MRRTRDGVLVLFHDDTLERATDGFGPINLLTYREVVALRPQVAFGRDLAGATPTFAGLLNLARQRAMLLHLDLKEPGLEGDIAQLLDAADAWDQVVMVNRSNASGLLRHPALHLLAYKGPGLYDQRRDMDPVAVRAMLDLPGQLILVDDPRVAAMVLHRPPYRPVAFDRRFRLTVRAAGPPPPPPTNEFSPAALVRVLDAWPDATSVPALTAILAADFPEADQFGGNAHEELVRHARIVKRAWAAQRLGRLRATSRPVVGLLGAAVRHRALDRDWRYHGLDGALAARALGKLGATEAAPALVEAFRRIDPDLRRVVAPALAGYPVVWADFPFKMYLLPALGDLPCAAAKRFLRAYVSFPEARARAYAPPWFEDATKALLRQRLAWDEIARLLRHPNPAVRGTALEECLDRPTEENHLALQRAAPWALVLPRAGR